MAQKFILKSVLLTTVTMAAVLHPPPVAVVVQAFECERALKREELRLRRADLGCVTENRTFTKRTYRRYVSIGRYEFLTLGRYEFLTKHTYHRYVSKRPIFCNAPSKVPGLRIDIELRAFSSCFTNMVAS